MDMSADRRTMDCASSDRLVSGYLKSKLPADSSEEIRRWPRWPHFKRKAAVEQTQSLVLENHAHTASRIIQVEVHLI